MSAKKYGPGYQKENDVLIKELSEKKEAILAEMQKLNEIYQETSTLRTLLVSAKLDLMKNFKRAHAKYGEVLEKSVCRNLRKWLCDIFIVSLKYKFLLLLLLNMVLILSGNSEKSYQSNDGSSQ